MQHAASRVHICSSTCSRTVGEKLIIISSRYDQEDEEQTKDESPSVRGGCRVNSNTSPMRRATRVYASPSSVRVTPSYPPALTNTSQRRRFYMCAAEAKQILLAIPSRNSWQAIASHRTNVDNISFVKLDTCKPACYNIALMLSLVCCGFL